MPPLVMTLRWAVLILWIMWLIIYWWGGLAILLVLIESMEAGKTRLDTALLLIIIALAQILLGTSVLVIYGFVPVMRWTNTVPVASFGALLVLVGVIGSTYCRYAMRHLWTAATNLHNQHRVIDTGLWGIVRHPLYGFVFLMYLGTTLIYAVWWEWLILVLLIAVHIKKLVDEERFLREYLPGYADYQRRVCYRIFPGIW